MPSSPKLSTYWLLAIYAFLRLFSFLTWNHSFLQALIAFCLVVGFSYICLKNLPTAWTILVMEFLLDGSGHFFELFDLLLRTWFLAIFGLIWLKNKAKSRSFDYQLPRSITISLAIFAGFFLLSIIRGFIFGHQTIPVLQDAMLYLFLFILFPGKDYLSSDIAPYKKIVNAFLIGSALFSLITLFIYSSKLGILQDGYYHWFRDVAGGKITDLGNNFFRVVLPEHLLIIPAVGVLAASLIMEPKSKKLWALLSVTLFILAINFTRIYFLALPVCFLVLVYKQSFWRWLQISILSFASLLLIFVITQGVLSHGRTFGLELLGIRTTGITAPQSEVSGAIRLALLPNIFETIRKHPWLGSGLSTEVQFVHPVTKQLEKRTQFDWGYLELIAELGILGTLAFLSLVFLTLHHLARLAYIQPKTSQSSQQTLLRGLLAGAVSLLVVNITTPAIFQGFGVLYLAYLIILVSQDKTAANISKN